MTTFKDGVYQWGGSAVGNGMLPVTGQTGTSGASKSFFVHGANGSDGNPGTVKAPLKTVSAAYDLCTAGAGDTVYVLNDGSTTASVREDAGLTWAKANTHLVGLCAPSINQRARITPTSGSTDVDAFTPMLTVSADGCIIKNISLVQGNSEDGKASVGIHVTGLRNYFENVSVLTGQHANQGDEAGTSWVRVDGEENVFQSCYIGTDTINRSAANANVKFGSGSDEEATRNVFRDCVFPAYADNDGVLFINAANATDTQRWNLFERCTFVNTGTTTMAEGVQYDGNGVLLLKDCGFYGCTNVVAADNTSTQLVGPAGSPNVDVGMFKGVDIA
jgi:hypothetical protein